MAARFYDDEPVMTGTIERPSEQQRSYAMPGVGAEQLPAIMPAGANSATDRASADIITAQRVAIKRDMPRILREIDEAANIAGEDFYYLWPTKNRDGTTGEVCGPSIECAMTLVNIWGNCRVEAFPAQETQTHWVFLARFVDFEKGVTVIRSFQQRRNQRAGGRMDEDRQLDIAFQIGQSKAVRNTIVAALKPYADRAVRSARRSAFGWVEKNLDRAKGIVFDLATELRVPQTRLERAVGAKADQWVARDLLTLRGKLLSIQDGFDTIDTAFPTEEQEAADAAASGQGQQQDAPNIPPKTEQKPAQQQQQQPERRQRAKPADKPAATDTKPPAQGEPDKQPDEATKDQRDATGDKPSEAGPSEAASTDQRGEGDGEAQSQPSSDPRPRDPEPEPEKPAEKPRQEPPKPTSPADDDMSELRFD